MIQQKSFTFQVKTVDDEQGLIEAYGSVFDYEDAGRDIVRPGAFKRTIANSKSRVAAGKAVFLAPMLWQHDANMPIGGWLDLTEDAHGLRCKGRVVLTTQQGREAYELMKAGVINEFSIGYDVPAKGAEYDGKTGVRNLNEIRLWEISPVTFPANDEALLIGVKSLSGLEAKAIVGNTAGKIGPRDEAWDSAKADAQIWAVAYDAASDKIDVTLAKKYFMVQDGDPQLKGSYSYPFWYTDPSPHICVAAVTAIAAAIQGSRGASPPDGLKAKIAALYARINTAYPDANQLTPPWGGKGHAMPRQTKTFAEHYAEEQCGDLLEDWQDVLICALSCAVQDAFRIGDQPEGDIQEALTAFNEAVMTWAAQGVQYGLSAYMASQDADTSDSAYTLQYGSDSRPAYGMSRGRPGSHKAMTESDATTGGFTADHVAKLKSAANRAMKSVASHAATIHEAADTVQTLVSGSKARQTKEGRAFSAANTQALADHAENLHDAADALTKSVNRQMKSVTNVADDLATVLQGSEAAYGTDPGTPEPGEQEGKKGTPYPRTRATPAPPSTEDTVSEQELQAALAQLRQLQTTRLPA